MVIWMYQFFVEDDQIQDTFVLIEGSDVNHIKNVLRMKPGERIRISNQSGTDYFCQISEVQDAFVRAEILEKDEKGTELQNKIYLFQGLPKNDKMELIIQKAVELGAYEVIPVAMKNCVVKLDAKKAENKVKRWQGIAESAAKQSKRSLIPNVLMPMSYREAVEYAKGMDVKLVPYENERGMKATKEVLSSIQTGQSIAVFIGPEGGFAPEEIEFVKDDMKLISLGKRILRTETAGMTALSILVYELESKEE